MRETVTISPSKVGFKSHPPHYTLKKALETVTKVDDSLIMARIVCASPFQHLAGSVPEF